MRPVTEPTGTSTLRAQLETSPDGFVHVWLEGAIDENSDLAGVFAKLTGDAVLHMQGVARVNSIGVHRWIPTLGGYAAQHRVWIDDISYALVQNANVVANLFGAATVRSCMAPYFCGTCKINCTESVSGEEVLEHAFAPPPRNCAKCGSAIEFDELDGYFAFFKRHARR